MDGIDRQVVRYFLAMEPDYEDIDTLLDWFDEQREKVATYLIKEKVVHGEIGEQPACFVPPYVAIWAVESLAQKGSVGWWAICGDLPTDYISSEDAKTPRQAAKAFGEIWMELAGNMQEGQASEDRSVGDPEKQKALGVMLEARAQTLLEWAGDDSLWE